MKDELITIYAGTSMADFENRYIPENKIYVQDPKNRLSIFPTCEKKGDKHFLIQQAELCAERIGGEPIVVKGSIYKSQRRRGFFDTCDAFKVESLCEIVGKGSAKRIEETPYFLEGVENRIRMRREENQGK
ncbi:hypothetical protein KY332_00920 [Candidatus Woesearchaeota archaeon]|nr:hypothetical protein [Candidatus Woesearchaeota archaeon]